ncbi:hypothetical protein GQS52_11340 [Streptomyces sp. SCUT-3]|uniref:hypothetical protein n=1 Tax=Streptomyces sp. SCUT-3 TaxID=2684469 RepID=UPI000CB86195|nr:hypothetical protein [Streptomyces sp. SCUT-3]PLW73241.1 hypothetical protein C0036_08290 [Streptomyces sp. DJ]QMV22287.1 hypothetical protein GQS52_11340 [Streptomyces sp. SCUT-3]
MLLPVDADQVLLVEAVRLARAPGRPFPETVVGEELAVWVEGEAEQVLGLIADLPDGERYRCFTPRYGVRAHGNTDVLFEAVFCFSCNGALFTGPSVPAGMRGIRTFDADSPPARELLRRFRSCDPCESAQ